ncbi:MAG: four helix bundle protein [Akkermansiaceae bacterium]
MTNANKEYDLEDRTLEFALSVRQMMKTLNRSITNQEDGKQLVRSSGSVGANYIEANEAISKKDFKFRIKLCRKEAKESRYWLRLLLDGNQEKSETITPLTKEAEELTKIFGSIHRKTLTND